MSCLPEFAFPYRVVQVKTVEKYFNGEEDAEVRKWAYLLETYKKRFEERTKLIFSLMLGFIVGLSSREPTSEILWQELFKATESLPVIQRQLLYHFGEGFLGTHKIHEWTGTARKKGWIVVFNEGIDSS